MPSNDPGDAGAICERNDVEDDRRERRKRKMRGSEEKRKMAGVEETAKERKNQPLSFNPSPHI